MNLLTKLRYKIGHDRYYSIARKVYQALSFTAIGRGFTCNCCGKSYRTTWFKAKLCPGCGSYPRHRLLVAYLARYEGHGVRHILHVAPEPFLAKTMKKLFPDAVYVPIDLNASKGTVQADLCRLEFLASETFDLVICMQVLEHIPDDYHAMYEIGRLLSRSGTAIIQVPIGNEFKEDFSITDPYQRELAFGQWDHVRVYDSITLARRLEHTGWFDVSYPTHRGDDCIEGYMTCERENHVPELEYLLRLYRKYSTFEHGKPDKGRSKHYYWNCPTCRRPVDSPMN